MKKSNKIKEFVTKASPMEWWEYAQEIKNASEELAKLNDNTLISKYDPDSNKVTKRPGVSRTYMLLIGICIENLIKGILIAENPEYIKDGKIDPKISTGHKLDELSILVRTFTFSPKEKNLIKKLGEAIPYWGKYPIPKKYELMRNETISSPEIRKMFLELFDKLELNIYNLTKFGWNGPNNVILKEWLVSHLEELPENHQTMPFSEIFNLRREKHKNSQNL